MLPALPSILLLELLFIIFKLLLGTGGFTSVSQKGPYIILSQYCTQLSPGLRRKENMSPHFLPTISDQTKLVSETH